MAFTGILCFKLDPPCKAKRAFRATNTEYGLQFRQFQGFLWVYLYLRLENDGLEQLRWNLTCTNEALRLKSKDFLQHMVEDKCLQACINWSQFTLNLFSDFGHLLESEPRIIFDLVSPRLSKRPKEGSLWQWKEYSTISRHALLKAFCPKPEFNIPTRRQLHTDVTATTTHQSRYDENPERLEFFHVSNNHGAVILSDYYLSKEPKLYVQEFSAGKRLPPMVCDVDLTVDLEVVRTYSQIVLLDSAFSSDENRISLVYGTEYGDSFFTCVWNLNERLDFSADPFELQWADVIFRSTSVQPICSNSAALVRFSGSNTLVFPGGQVDLTNNHVLPFALQMLGLVLQIPGYRMLTLYREGEALVSDPMGDQFRGYESTRFSTCGEKIDEIYVPDDGRKTMEFSELPIADLSCRWVLWSFNASKLPMLVLHNPRTGHHVGTNIIYERGNHTSSPDGRFIVFASHIGQILLISTWSAFVALEFMKSDSFFRLQILSLVLSLFCPCF